MDNDDKRFLCLIGIIAFVIVNIAWSSAWYGVKSWETVTKNGYTEQQVITKTITESKGSVWVKAN